MRNQIYLPSAMVLVLPVDALADNGLSGFRVTSQSGPPVTLEWSADGTDWTPLDLPVTLAPGLLRLSRSSTAPLASCLNGEYTTADGNPPGGPPAPTWEALTELQRTDLGDGTTLVSFTIPADINVTADATGLRGVTGTSPVLFALSLSTPPTPAALPVGEWASTNADVGQGSGYAFIARVQTADLATITAFELQHTPI